MCKTTGKNPVRDTYVHSNDILSREANVNDPSDLKFETLILNSGREAKQDKPCWELQIAVKSGSKDKPCWELQMDIADISLEMEKVGKRCKPYPGR